MSPMATGFVGGTGRSGTTIVGQLLGSHPAYEMIPIEVRFIVGPGGLCDLVEGRKPFGVFRSKILGPWFHRELADGQVRGLHQIVNLTELELGLDALRRGLASNPRAAGRRFVHRLLDPIAAAGNATGWVEQTPPNVLAAPCIARLFPAMKLIHVIRDGRDVACSVAPLGWGPDDIIDGLDWWADRLERGFSATAALPSDRVHVVRIEALARDERDLEYVRLLAFLGLDDDPAMRAFFESRLTPANAHIGRWLDDVPAARRRSFEAHHRALMDGMRARGVAADCLSGVRAA
jgi:Sulfotransferase family